MMFHFTDNLSALLFGYLLGSIPFGVLIAASFGLGNLRNIGSGNIGATNVLRTGNKLAAFLTLLLDGGKGAAAVLLVPYFQMPMGWHFDSATPVQFAAVGAFIGHCYPVWLRFAGGKGVATFLGILLALDFFIGLGVCAVWLITAFALRYSSLAALVAAALAPVFLWLMGQSEMAFTAEILAAVIFWRHRSNIKRLLSGVEPKIGKKEKS